MSSFGVQVIDVCLEKFKERKMAVVEALKECIDATYLTVKFYNSSTVNH